MMEEYCPLQCLNEEIQRFKATNQFSPMLVTGFYLQAACVVTELNETRELIVRLAEWDKRYPVGRINPARGEHELNDIIRTAHFIRKRYPSNLGGLAPAPKEQKEGV